MHKSKITTKPQLAIALTINILLITALYFAVKALQNL